jgi:hypothetical protein
MLFVVNWDERIFMSSAEGSLCFANFRDIFLRCLTTGCCKEEYFDVTGEYRILHSEGFRNFYSPPHIIRIIKPRTMRWASHVSRRQR